MAAFEDRFEIRELIDRWSDAVNEQNWDHLASCFIEDGVWDVGAPFNFVFKGKEIVEKVPGLIEAQKYVIQTPHAVAITLNGDTATSRATMHESTAGHDGTGLQMWGTYYDDLVRTPVGWRFKVRKFRVAFITYEPLPGELMRSYGGAV
jgi:ketosteroid isomerase-like protein